MSEDQKHPFFEPEKETDGLEFKDAKEMTVEEAVRKDSEIKAGITEEDSILDKYIKQHRDEVASQKFETKSSDFANLDTASLDDFIKKQREELSAMLAAEELSKKLDNSVSQEQDTEANAVSPKEESSQEQENSVIPVPPLITEAEPTATEPDSTIADSEEYKSSSKKRGGIVGTLIALILLLIVAIFGYNYFKNNNSTNSQTATSQSSSSKATTTSSEEDKKASQNLDNFNKAYANFFVDDKKNQLKNSEFDKLSELEKKVDALKGTKYYGKVKVKFDSLKRQIDAVKAVNDKFKLPAVVDGKKSEKLEVKDGANFDSLDSKTLNTGNASLDSLLHSIVSTGRNQVKQSEEQAKKTQEEQASSNKVSDTQTTEQPNVTNGQSSSSAATINNQAAGTASGNLERNRSRVPYNNAAIADTGNPAWIFNPGVLEKIVATSQARGYFSGNNYILEPVNIINGNGYYNMFKLDGTYLFSINAKTGYFVGNAPGRADSLDY
ncbi:TPA: cell division site-positioning protein MapZ family protein [Streptococcus agalactiae]